MLFKKICTSYAITPEPLDYAMTLRAMARGANGMSVSICLIMVHIVKSPFKTEQFYLEGIIHF